MNVWVIYGECNDWEEVVFITSLWNLKETTDRVRGHVIGCVVYRLAGTEGRHVCDLQRVRGLLYRGQLISLFSFYFFRQCSCFTS